MSATLKNPKTCGVVLAQLDSQLEMRVFIEGHSASLADVMLWEVMVMSRAVDKQLPAHPHVARWKAHMDSLPAFKAALASAGASPSAAAAPAAASAAPAKDSAKKAAAPAEGKAAKAPAAAGAADKKADAAAPAGGKKEKKEKKAAPAGGGGKAAAPATDWSGPAISYLDLRVGKIIDCVAVKESDKLYQETIDLGEESGPRTILSGLQQFVKLEDMQNRMVCCVINLKPRPMGPDKTKSAGMVLCAQNADHTVVVPVNPPAGAKIGDVISFEGCESTPAGENQVAKKKLWEAAAPDLHTNGDGVACWKDKTWNTPAGPCTAPGMANAPIS
jgi:aminoacyl tRNA synthase complex-interacting multifunctional protein 1